MSHDSSHRATRTRRTQSSSFSWRLSAARGADRHRTTTSRLRETTARADGTRSIPGRPGNASRIAPCFVPETAFGFSTAPTRPQTGLLAVNCEGSTGLNGTPSEPVVIEAVNERQAFLKGDGSGRVIWFRNCSYYRVQGLHIESADNAGFQNAHGVVEFGGSESQPSAGHRAPAQSDRATTIDTRTAISCSSMQTQGRLSSRRTNSTFFIATPCSSSMAPRRSFGGTTPTLEATPDLLYGPRVRRSRRRRELFLLPVLRSKLREQCLGRKHRGFHGQCLRTIERQRLLWKREPE